MAAHLTGSFQAPTAYDAGKALHAMQVSPALAAMLESDEEVRRRLVDTAKATGSVVQTFEDADWQAVVRGFRDGRFGGGRRAPASRARPWAPLPPRRTPWLLRDRRLLLGDVRTVELRT